MSEPAANGTRSQQLSAARAILDSIFNAEASFFPRFRNGGDSPERLEEGAMISEINAALQDIANPSKEDLEGAIARTRETLDEVKSLTEYQDQKATRILTIIAFLTALSGALFARLADDYPLRMIFDGVGVGSAVLIVLTYGVFFLFVLSVVCGALVVFHATRTRFKYPVAEPEQEDKRRSVPRSYLFYSGIIEMRPAAWVGSFTAPKSGSTAQDSVPKEVLLNQELGMRYLKNHIAESYLVAAKAADKLRYLQPAQDVLAFSVRALVLWIVLFGATVLLVETPVTPIEPAHSQVFVVPPSCGSSCGDEKVVSGAPIAFAPIEFHTGSSKIGGEGLTRISIVREWLRAHPESVILLRSHTDTVGTPTVNESLAVRRGSAVREVLLEAGGVAANRVFLSVMPEHDLATVTGQETAAARNRSVEFSVAYPSN